jgi:hypothetical protein
MNSFREKFGLLMLTDASQNEPLTQTTTTTASMHEEVIELLIGSNSHESFAGTLEGRKKRADTAETETSFPLQSVTREDSRLEGIGSYDDDECVIYCADSSLSLSGDEIDLQRKHNAAENAVTLTPLDTASVFAEADTMLGISNNATTTGNARDGKRKKRNGNSNKLMGLFSSGRIVPVGRNKTNVFSRNNSNKSLTTTISTSAARSRKFFSVSKVPASIAEEPCNTPSSTSASVASSP